MIWWILLIVLLWGRRFLHFFVQDVPLGYDPGMYRSYLMAFTDMIPYLDYSRLEPRMNEWFPPFLGFFSTLLEVMSWITPDWLITRWIWRQSVLLCFAMYVMMRPFWKKVAVVSALLTRISFVQYQLFRRNYIKQLWGAFFVLIVLWLLLRRKYILTVPILVSLFLVHRPAALMIWWTVVVYVLYSMILILTGKKDLAISRNDIMKYLWIFLGSSVLSLVLYWELFQQQLLPLFWRFIWSLSLPDYSWWAQGWWTFLTIGDYLKTNGVVIVLSLVGWISLFKKRWFTLLHAWWLFWVIWVFAQLAFYKRMIWYADLFFIALASSWLVFLRNSWSRTLLSWKITKILLWSMVLIHCGIFWYRVERTRRPIMQADEFAFFKTLPQILPEDALVMSTFSTYSWWLKWRSERPTLAPWLFNDDKRNKQEWIDNRREATWEEKCSAIRDSYWEIWGDLYIWQWSKQPPTDFSSASCLKISHQSENKKRRLYRMTF